MRSRPICEQFSIIERISWFFRRRCCWCVLFRSSWLLTHECEIFSPNTCTKNNICYVSLAHYTVRRTIFVHERTKKKKNTIFEWIIRFVWFRFSSLAKFEFMKCSPPPPQLQINFQNAVFFSCSFSWSRGILFCLRRFILTLNDFNINLF